METAVAGLCKLLLCVLLTQFGKTFEAINCIKMQFDNDDKEGRSIHMVFTMNTLLNNSQFVKRLEEIQDKYGKGSVLVFASKYGGTLYDHVKSLEVLKGRCVNTRTCPRVVVMCSNKYRFEDGVEFLKWIDDAETTVCIKRCFVYYDELHKYINDKLRAQIMIVHALRCVSEIIGLTATPFNIWGTGVWNNIKIRYVSDFYEANYCGFKDMEFRNVDFPWKMPVYSNFGSKEANALTSSYIMGCIRRYPEILADGSRVFIPGHVQKKNHFDIRQRIFEYKRTALVVVLNGEEKTLSYMDPEGDKMFCIHIGGSDEEVCTTIAQTIKSKGFGVRPLVITGFLCVGMGQTLTHHELGSFTSAIIGHEDLYLDDIYQLFGRITGRMKFWGDKYCKTVVYSPKSVMLRFKAAESLARNMALKHNNTVACKKDYLTPLQYMGEAGMAAVARLPPEKMAKAVSVKRIGSGALPLDKYKYDMAEFDTEDPAIEFWGNIPGTVPRRITRVNEQGYMLCSGTKGNEVLSYQKVCGLCKPEKGAAMPCHPGDIKPGQTVVRRYVCYKNNDASKPTFVIRWIKRL